MFRGNPSAGFRPEHSEKLPLLRRSDNDSIQEAASGLTGIIAAVEQADRAQILEDWMKQAERNPPGALVKFYENIICCGSLPASVISGTRKFFAYAGANTAPFGTAKYFMDTLEAPRGVSLAGAGAAGAMACVTNACSADSQEAAIAAGLPPFYRYTVPANFAAFGAGMSSGVLAVGGVAKLVALLKDAPIDPESAVSIYGGIFTSITNTASSTMVGTASVMAILVFVQRFRILPTRLQKIVMLVIALIANGLVMTSYTGSPPDAAVQMAGAISNHGGFEKMMSCIIGSGCASSDTAMNNQIHASVYAVSALANIFGLIGYTLDPSLQAQILIRKYIPIGVKKLVSCISGNTSTHARQIPGTVVKTEISPDSIPGVPHFFILLLTLILAVIYSITFIGFTDGALVSFGVEKKPANALSTLAVGLTWFPRLLPQAYSLAKRAFQFSYSAPRGRTTTVYAQIRGLTQMLELLKNTPNNETFDTIVIRDHQVPVAINKQAIKNRQSNEFLWLVTQDDDYNFTAVKSAPSENYKKWQRFEMAPLITLLFPNVDLKDIVKMHEWGVHNASKLTRGQTAKVKHEAVFSVVFPAPVAGEPAGANTMHEKTVNIVATLVYHYASLYLELSLAPPHRGRLLTQQPRNPNYMQLQALVELLNRYSSEGYKEIIVPQENLILINNEDVRSSYYVRPAPKGRWLITTTIIDKNVLLCTRDDFIALTSIIFDTEDLKKLRNDQEIYCEIIMPGTEYVEQPSHFLKPTLISQRQTIRVKVEHSHTGESRLIISLFSPPVVARPAASYTPAHMLDFFTPQRQQSPQVASSDAGSTSSSSVSSSSASTTSSQPPYTYSKLYQLEGEGYDNFDDRSFYEEPFTNEMV